MSNATHAIAVAFMVGLIALVVTQSDSRAGDCRSEGGIWRDSQCLDRDPR